MTGTRRVDGLASTLQLESYGERQRSIPKMGRHILAQFDDESIVVYQAYRPEIGHFAAKHGYFGGEFSLSRMSWIKPNFLWMMYRSGWGQKEGQEVVLAVRLQRSAFDEILAQAVPSSNSIDTFRTHEEWKAAMARSSVRLQWDPDRSPKGGPLERRAIQLGLRGAVLASYSRDWLVGIDDVSELVAEQREIAFSVKPDALMVPTERVYPVADIETARRIGLSDHPGDLD
ncbi:MAG: DUF4291 domain-containing protein [Phycisphaerales bacterium]|nr:DUF4291 domain-containing protein [Phycisphaerales bacterium]MCB9863614.1 DUF4291 domain-containing protein [Phycisphaerales bacterium]